MINLTRAYQVTGGSGSYNYMFQATDPCVTFSDQSGTTNTGYISSVITFRDLACLNAAIVTLVVTDVETGCKETIGVVITNPCSSFSTSDISQSDPYIFTVSAASPGCRQLTYTWYYDTAVFDIVNQINSNGGSVLTLSIRPGLSVYPSSSSVSVRVVDCNGCDITKSITTSICSGDAQDFPVSLFCTDTVFISSSITFPDPLGCSALYDWTTLSLSLPSGWAFVGTAGIGYFTAPSGTLAGNYAGQYSVQTTTGITTTLGTIAFTVNTCDTGNNISIPNRVINVPCDLNPGDVIEVVVENDPVVSPGNTIDWSTWQLTLPSPIPSYITLTTNVGGDHVILYELQDPIIPDVFGYTVCLTSGQCAETSIYTIVPCPTSPTAINDDACAYCNESSIISVLDNDVTAGAPFDVTSIGIVTFPTKGTVSLPDDGTVVYVPNPGQVGADSFTYSVADTNGGQTNIATVNIDIICAGVSSAVTTCQ